MILFGLALALVVIYAFLVIIAGVGWLRQKPGTKKSIPAEITVVVPFRNEEKNLDRLLRNLTAKENVTVILVNDHSTDDSLQVIGRFKAENPGVKIFLVQNEGEGKKAASATGIKLVTTPYVFLTDADCLIPNTATGFADYTDQENFFSEISVICGESGIDFFYGPVVYGFPGERINNIFFLDQLALNAIALGLGKNGIHTYCSGANMGGKTAFLQSVAPQLQQSNNLSGDDVTYLQAAVKQKKKIVALTDRELMIYTVAPGSWKEFLGQRLRWGQKASGYTNFALLGLSALVWAVCVIVLATVICCISGALSPSWWMLPTIKLCIDLLFLFLVALRLNVHARLWAFLPAWVLNLMYIPVVAVLGIFTNTSWKGRKVRI